MSKITFVGDTFIDREFTFSLPYKNLVINLEAPITNAEHAAPNKINLRTPIDIFESCKGFSPLAACLANNHISDYLDEGLKDTLSFLTAKKINFFGAGFNRQEAIAPIYLDIEGEKIALIGAACESTSPIAATDSCAGIAINHIEDISRSVKEARDNDAKMVIVCYHWGAEEVGLPKPSDIELGRRTIDVGADMIIGHHTHCIHPYEVYKGKYIFYGLGNFLFNDFEVGALYSNEKNGFLSTFKKKQEYWNNRSLAVTLDVKSTAVQVDILKQKEAVISVHKASTNQYLKKMHQSFFYNKKFKMMYFLSKLKSIFFRFLRNPKIPKVKHLMGIITIAKSSQFK